MTSNDNTTWLGVFTPRTNTEEDNNTLSLATSYTDLAGNAGPAATTANYAIDTLLPTISSVTAGWGTFLNATEDNSSGTVTVVTSGAENGQTVTVALNSDNYTDTVLDNSTSVTFAVNGLQALTDGDNYTLTTNVSDAAGNAATVNTGTSFTYDITAPTISGGVAITSATGIQNNLLNAGDNVSATVTFSEVVNKTGTPQLTLAVGDDNQTATYTSGSGGTTLVFKYTIQAGDNDTDGISIGANVLALDNGTISDPAGNNATLTHSPVSDNSSYKVDTTPPTISSVTAGWGTYLNATEDDSAGTVTVVTSGAENGQTVTVTLNSTNYTGTVSDNSTAVTVAASGLQALTDGDNYTLTTNVSDAAGNAATVNTGTSFTYDRTPPSISGAVAITSATGIQNNLLNAGDNVSVTVTFSENSPVTGTPQLTLAVGEDNHTADYTSSGSGATTKVFKYTIQAGDNDTNGISIRANALALNSGTIMDPAGNNATLTHIAVLDNSSYMVDTEAPRVDNFTLSDTALKIGDNATVNLGFSEAVASFSSAVDITVPNLDNGTTSGTLAAMTSSDNITWAGRFTPLANTEEDNNTLSLGTSYTDLAGNAGPAATTANYAIDTLLPTISSVTAGWGTFLNATEDNSDGTVTIVTSGAENGQRVTVALNSTIILTRSSTIPLQ